jgi:hypothetical protein
MTDNDDNHDKSREPDAEDQRWSNRSDIRWPNDREVG